MLPGEICQTILANGQRCINGFGAGETKGRSIRCSIARYVIDTANGYTYAPLSAVEAAGWVLNGERYTGFATPAQVFWSGFAKGIVDTQITDL